MNVSKEVKSVKIVPYTIMSASLNAVWGLVFAIILLIFGGTIAAFLPSELAVLSSLIVGISVAGILVFPVGAFLFSIMPSFLYALIYNLLVPKLGGVKFEISEMTEITRFDVVPVALISAAVAAVFQFIVQLVMAPLQAVMVGAMGGIIRLAAAAMNNTTTSAMPAFGTMGAFGAILNIIISPIITFIMMFIGIAIFALLFNFLAPKVGGIKLELSQLANNFFGIENINAVALGLITGVITAVLGLIIGIIMLIILAAANAAVAGIIILLTYTIGGFIVMFIVYALTALFYNVLAPRIGAIKIELE
ncbi:hypothetical protein [Methanobacterium alcaliphilum]|uniref:hypothetical protein n=1 Tax=Methanobacterium alcaliphilum TaxID=392018 RepID=UPI00200B9F79|nr:hypothetical protein [Methanobacterium alcaliphilum]MCK9152003.1 hypothetical protein [Methanobacterium alcaliphilum]